jgi:Domain of unknown function (DUF4124)
MKTMARWNVVVLAALLGLTVSLPASAQWKWKDKSGQTQYSDLPPPPGVPDQDILLRPSSSSARRAPPPPLVAASSAPLVAAHASDPELEARRKKAEQDVADKKKADEAKIAANKAENCARARDAARTLDSGIRVARANAQGEREVMDDTMRASESKKAHDVMASDCN